MVLHKGCLSITPYPSRHPFCNLSSKSGLQDDSPKPRSSAPPMSGILAPSLCQLHIRDPGSLKVRGHGWKEMFAVPVQQIYPYMKAMSTGRACIPHREKQENTGVHVLKHMTNLNIWNTWTQYKTGWHKFSHWFFPKDTFVLLTRSTG